MSVVAATAVVIALAGCGSGESKPTSAGQTTANSGAVSVKVASPADGSVVRTDRVSVRGTVNPPDAEVRVLGQAAQVGNGVFTASVPVHRGSNSIDVVVSAPGVTPATVTVNVTRRTRTTSSTPPATAKTPDTSGSMVSSTKSCGNGLGVSSTTSCPFAENVRAAYQQTGSGVLSVFSPATGKTYTVYCTSGSTHVCTGGVNAVVVFGDVSGYSTSGCSGLTVGPNTSCAFGANVRDAYYAAGGDSVISVYSPVTGQTYTMYCSTGSPHACTGGNNASVYFP